MGRGDKPDAGESPGIDLDKLIQVGRRLSRLPSSKDVLIELLKEASALLLVLKQRPGHEVLSALKPCMDALVKPGLLKHKDKDIQVLVASCISEVLRIVAPDAPFSDETWEEIFELIVATFKGLSDISSMYFTTRLHILCTVASVRSCIVMLNIECNDLIYEMFQTFFTTVREKPTQMMAAMKKIMCLILLENEEEVPQPLIEVLLSHLLSGRKGVSKAAYILAGAVFEECANHIKLYGEEYVTSILLEGKSSKSKWRDCYDELIFEIYVRAPSLVIQLIPKLKDDLLSEKVDIRLKAIKLTGHLFASRKGVAEKFNHLFNEFLKRFNDKSVDVRCTMAECGKNCLISNTSASVVEDILATLSEHIQDIDDGVRIQVVDAICEYAVSNPDIVPVGILRHVAERLRDTEMHVRRETLHKLTQVYQAFCSKMLEGTNIPMESFNWIPSKLIRCCFDKEGKELRSQGIELFSDQLFPADFPVNLKVQCWISLFSFFDENDVKALERILHQRQRLHVEMQNYIELQLKGEDEKTQDNTKRLLISCKNMGPYFIDPENAESELYELSKLKDGDLLKDLSRLLDANTTLLQSVSLRENLLKRIDEEHPRHEFLKTLTRKCSYVFFGKEHMQDLVAHVEDYKRQGDEKSLQTSMGLIVALAKYFPSILEGLEENIMELIKDDREFLREGCVQIFSSLRGQLTEDSSSVDLLEKLCVEGTRNQAKYAVKALAAISGDSGMKIFSTLYRKLLDLLMSGTNPPTILQSLGCIAQYDVSVFETSEEVLVNFLTKDLFRKDSVSSDKELPDGSVLSETTYLKIFGLKALIRSFLPRKVQQQIQRFKGLSGILSKFVESGEVSDDIKSSQFEKDHLRLAAGKGILKLSKRYDAQISPKIFHAVVSLAMDSSEFVRSDFLRKLRKLLREQSLPEKYACALALTVGGTIENDLLAEVKQELSDFIETSHRQIRLRDITASGQSEDVSVFHSPEYVLFFFVHTLAHGAGFSSQHEGGLSNETVNVFFKQLSLYLWALLSNFSDDKEDDLVKYSLVISIFHKMKASEDKIDSSKTENTYVLCDIGIMITKDFAGVEIPNHKDADKIPLPVSIYKPLENETSESQVDGSHLPSILVENDNFLQMKSSLPFRMEKVSKKQHVKAAEGHAVEDTNHSHDGFKSDTASAEEEIESQKMIQMTKNSEDEGQVVDPSNENHRVSKRKRNQAKTKRKSETELPHPAPSNSRRRGRKSKEQKIEEHQISEMDEIDEPAKKSERTSRRSPNPSEELTDEEQSNETKRSISEQELLPKVRRTISKWEKSAESKRLRGTKDIDGTVEAQAVSSPRGTPKRSAKKTDVSVFEKSNSKLSKKMGTKELVGCRVKVWWPLDKKFYNGRIESYHAKIKSHKVVYDDGDVELLRLEKERWELLEDSEDELGSPSTPVRSELAIQAKRTVERQTKIKPRVGTSAKRSSSQFKPGANSASKQATSEQRKADLDVDAKEPHQDLTDGLEASERPHEADEEMPPLPNESKLAEKSLRVSGKNSVGKSKASSAEVHNKSAEKSTQDDVSSPNESRDSDDVPLDEWKSSRKKARLQE